MQGEYGAHLPVESIVSLVVWFLCVLYASIRSSSHSSLGKITGGGEETALGGPSGQYASGHLTYTLSLHAHFSQAITVPIALFFQEFIRMSEGR